MFYILWFHIEAQQERIRAYAAMRGLELVHIHVEQGVSGKIPLRLRPEGASWSKQSVKSAPGTS